MTYIEEWRWDLQTEMEKMEKSAFAKSLKNLCMETFDEESVDMEKFKKLEDEVHRLTEEVQLLRESLNKKENEGYLCPHCDEHGLELVDYGEDNVWECMKCGAELWYCEDLISMISRCTEIRFNRYLRERDEK